MQNIDEIKKYIEGLGATAAYIRQDEISYDIGFREICRQNSCGNFGCNYMCPPHIGSADDCMNKAKSFGYGVLWQKIYPIEDSFDIEGMHEAAKDFSKTNISLRKFLKADPEIAGSTSSNFLQLGAGACLICERCAMQSGIPCRNPGLAIPSMESYCMNVAKTAQSAGLKYINGENTVTYFGLVLTDGNDLVIQPESAGLKIECGGYIPPHKQNPAPGHYAIAVDLGTTTIVARAINLQTAQLYEPAFAPNPQRAIGADVMSRIDAAIKGQLESLHKLVKDKIDELCKAAAANAGITTAQIDQKIITGNTSQLYLYTGRSPKSLAAAPFDADCLFGFEEDGIIYPPCFGAFVGADIYTAILASGMLDKDETAILADLGTNGEIALYHKGKLYCCATACGPAFESSTQLYGSELIELIAKLLDEGLISESGRLEAEYKTPAGAVLRPSDVRNVQLAKAAICAGILSLTQICGVDCSEISTLYLAGGFGKHLDSKAAVRIGLFPPEFENKIVLLGNAALSGAILMMLDKDSDRRDITQGASCINLAKTEEFSENYMDQIGFL